MKAARMTTYISVCRSDALGFIPLETREMFERCMRQTLGYVRVKLSIKLASGAYLVTPAPLGAVKNEEDADRLIADLRRELPNVPFGMAVQTFDTAGFLLSRAARANQPATLVA
jgi:hypothetical protein